MGREGEEPARSRRPPHTGAARKGWALPAMGTLAPVILPCAFKRITILPDAPETAEVVFNREQQSCPQCQGSFRD